MSVYDRWHKSRPEPGEAKCREHRGKVPSAVHGTGLRWQVRGINADGKPVKRNFDYEDQAKASDAELKAAVRAGTYVDERAGRVTLQVRAEEWRRARTHDAATQERIRSFFANHVYEDPAVPGRTPKGAIAIGSYPVGALARRPSLISDWIASVDLHPNSTRLLIGHVRRVFVAALDDGLIARNPFDAGSVDRPKRVRHEAKAWTAAQVGAVASRLPGRWEALAWLGAACGQRQGELFGTSLEDLDFLRKMCHVEVQVKNIRGTLVFAQTKNKKIRDVPVAAPVIPLLSEHVRRFPPAAVTLPWEKPGGKLVTRRLIFTRPGGLALTRNAFYRPWLAAREGAAIPDAEQANGCHVLRHTAASAWLSGGLSLAKVAAYLGDTKEMVVSTYAHFLPDDDDRARGIMDAFLGGLREPSSAPVMPRALGE